MQNGSTRAKQGPYGCMRICVLFAWFFVGVQPIIPLCAKGNCKTRLQLSSLGRAASDGTLIVVASLDGRNMVHAARAGKQC
eukprot:6179095-Pleurochrysis_carterae.AAC.1